MYTVNIVLVLMSFSWIKDDKRGWQDLFSLEPTINELSKTKEILLQSYKNHKKTTQYFWSSAQTANNLSMHLPLHIGSRSFECSIS